jgi:hypothetical protein
MRRPENCTPKCAPAMSRNFLLSGIYELLDELSQNAPHSYEYGRHIALTDLCFDEDLVIDRNRLLSELERQPKTKGPSRIKNPYEW